MISFQFCSDILNFFIVYCLVIKVCTITFLDSTSTSCSLNSPHHSFGGLHKVLPINSLIKNVWKTLLYFCVQILYTKNFKFKPGPILVNTGSPENARKILIFEYAVGLYNAISKSNLKTVLIRFIQVGYLFDFAQILYYFLSWAVLIIYF